MKVFGSTHSRLLAALFLCGAFIFALWYFQAPPTDPSLNAAPLAPITAQGQPQAPPAPQAHIKAESSNLASPETISNRAAEKVKEYAEVRRKLRSGEITELPVNLAPPPIPASIETPDTNP